MHGWMALALAVYVPAPQAVQADAPGTVAVVPAAHALQVVRPGWAPNVPAEQFVHELAPTKLTVDVPDGQVRHWVTLRGAKTLIYFPATQDVQVVVA